LLDSLNGHLPPFLNFSGGLRSSQFANHAFSQEWNDAGDAEFRGFLDNRLEQFTLWDRLGEGDMTGQGGAGLSFEYFEVQVITLRTGHLTKQNMAFPIQHRYSFAVSDS
jgi:hypothetical protein